MSDGSKQPREPSPQQRDLSSKVDNVSSELERIVLQISRLDGVDMRAVAIARTELQTGLMWLKRAMAPKAV